MTENYKQVAIVTVSDSSYYGEREDSSGPILAEVFTEAGFSIIGQTILPDETDMIESTLRQLAEYSTPLVITTGGTGVGPRDVTPEATRAVIEREVPGLAEEMRRQGLCHTRYAILSRGIAGVLEKTMIINLPGSPQGAVDSIKAVLDVLPHALSVLTKPKFNHDTEQR